MSSTVFQIKNGSAWHDYSDMVKMSGMGWKRNDLDADGSGRSPLDGYMWRSVVARKRSISYDLMPDREARYASLDTDLQQPFFDVKYADLHGIQEKTFYCSSFEATLDEDIEDQRDWSGGKFTIIER